MEGTGGLWFDSEIEADGRLAESLLQLTSRRGCSGVVKRGAAGRGEPGLGQSNEQRRKASHDGSLPTATISRKNPPEDWGNDAEAEDERKDPEQPIIWRRYKKRVPPSVPDR